MAACLAASWAFLVSSIALAICWAAACGSWFFCMAIWSARSLPLRSFRAFCKAFWASSSFWAACLASLAAGLGAFLSRSFWAACMFLVLSLILSAACGAVFWMSLAMSLGL